MTGRTRMRAVLACATLLLPGAGAAAPETYPAGKIVDGIACASDPRFHFALYLPSKFDAAREWPLLFVFDPRGRGAVAAELFREGAERYGWIIVSSNDTRSDDPKAPNAEVLRALWSEIPGRFPVDRKRISAAGFSGGARLAFVIGLSRKNALAGVIASSGGLPQPGRGESRLSPDPDLPVYGTAGTTDFNWLEMRMLDRALGRRGAPHRLAIFEGGHSWPPAAVATDAVGWLEAQAMRKGLRSKDGALAGSLFERAIEEAGEREHAGDAAGAWGGYASAIADFADLTDVARARESEKRLRAGGEKRAGEEEKRDLREGAETSKRLDTLNAALSAADVPPFPAVANRLEISGLRSRASAGDESSRATARREIESIFVQTVFYLPRDYFASGDVRRALLCLEVATALKPESVTAWYDLACARARSGDSARAIAALRTAVERGFRDAAHAAEDSDLATLRERPDFQAILEGMRAQSAH